MQADSIIIEIRAGTGGEEAALFARDLFRMYKRYGEAKNWQLRVLDEHETEMAGFRQLTFQIKGEGVASKMKYEAGVHRVQRIPKTEKGNRIHTSTASVAVLPVPEKAEIRINPNDIKMDFFKASGHGGQNVNKRQTAIRITHLPSGLVVSSQTQRNLEQNKQAALNILEAKLYEIEKKEREAEIKEERRSQIGGAERAEKIRTYNFPQNRITDHRINKKWHNLEKILDGQLEPVIDALQKSLC